MRVLRVTEITSGMGVVPWHVRHAGYLGERIHEHLFNIHSTSNEGWVCEKQQVICLAKKDTTKKWKIGGLLTGTPDMLKVVGDTLYVVDFKTRAEGVIKIETHGIDQTSLYAFQYLTNYPQKKIKKVVLEIGTYGRQKTIAEALTRRHRHTLEIDAEKLQKNVLTYLRRKLQQRINPFSEDKLTLEETNA